MVARGGDPPRFVTPRYRARAGASWYHFLYGNVPNHQLDFIYNPEIPQGPLSPTHFSHMSRLMKYVEPHSATRHAFAIGNLSRDDSQYEPGHGGLALIWALRVQGVTDHAGRRDPPFTHGIAAVDRNLTRTALLEATLRFSELIGCEHESQGASSRFYRHYARAMEENATAVPDLLGAYVGEFDWMAALQESKLSLGWLTDGALQPKRIGIVYGERAPFGALAHCASKIGAMLYRSDIRWTAITSGREADIPNGVTIRLMAGHDVTPDDGRELLVPLDQVPDNEGEIAQRLFGAKPIPSPREASVGWREALGGPRTSAPPEPPTSAASPVGSLVIPGAHVGARVATDVRGAGGRAGLAGVQWGGSMLDEPDFAAEASEDGRHSRPALGDVPAPDAPAIRELSFNGLRGALDHAPALPAERAKAAESPAASIAQSGDAPPVKSAAALDEADTEVDVVLEEPQARSVEPQARSAEPHGAPPKRVESGAAGVGVGLGIGADAGAGAEVAVDAGSPARLKGGVAEPLRHVHAAVPAAIATTRAEEAATDLSFDRPRRGSRGMRRGVLLVVCVLVAVGAYAAISGRLGRLGRSGGELQGSPTGTAVSGAGSRPGNAGWRAGAEPNPSTKDVAGAASGGPDAGPSGKSADKFKEGKNSGKPFPRTPRPTIFDKPLELTK